MNRYWLFAPAILERFRFSRKRGNAPILCFHAFPNAKSLRIFAGIALAATTFAGVEQASAGECSAPCIDYYAYMETVGNWNRFPARSDDDYFAAAPTVEFTASYRPVEGVAFFGHLITEEVKDEEPGVNQYFHHVGTYVSELNAQFHIGGIGLRVGKFHPAFGKAWDITPGIHGTDLAGNYELKERVGASVAYGFETGSFHNEIEFAAFGVDRSSLSESLFTNRGRHTLEDGGAGNSDGISSVALDFAGCLGAGAAGCYDEGSFGYRLGARYQKGGEHSFGNETGLLGGLNGNVALGNETTLKLFTEAAWFNNFGGGPDDALFLTVSAALQREAMTYSIAYTQQREQITDEPDLVEHLFDATVAYKFGQDLGLSNESWQIAAGYAFDKHGDDRKHTFGIRLSAEFEGSHEFH
ncbi:MAG TPA: hypothetical protein VGV39_26930 [Mesorhizobium sp.]|jgi:hypothetical protein|uniref:hypothetical protein n=1 Tax=Mesorhizobium sp. TaxID=1871066 RepID=UPI002DDDB1D5|nr:hypothetical protein [Mesorhizobium sp.]HEV2506736.1 hypothetical protein [Mesorhizobium sp.]